ncbi:mitochondrial transcription factor 2, partial [Coemansia sp. RSA 485]
MTTESLKQLAALVCVATNAYPRLSEELLARVAESETGQTAAPGILEVLRIHGGERFGEKDNTNELSVLQKWLNHCTETVATPVVSSYAAGQPSFCDLFDVLLSANKHSRVWPPATLAVNEIELVRDGRRSIRLAELLAQKWIGGEPRTSIPSLLFVKGPLSVSTLADNSFLDFSSAAGDDESGMARRAQLEKAQRSYTDSQNVLKSIGVAEPQNSCENLRQSLDAVRKWISLVTTDGLPKQWRGTLESKCQILASELSSYSGIWETIITRVDDMETHARVSLEALERRPKYVLRAFVVKESLGNRTATDNSNGSSNASYTVVRRFGKAEGASHYSVLTSDSVCWPTRIQDIQGTVLESMWVCCNDDSECIAGAAAAAAAVDNGPSSPGGSIDQRASQGVAVNPGMNTVVADPDDEIYCDFCLDMNSFSYDQIIICDKCERGVHQMCHVPIVTEDE